MKKKTGPVTTYVICKGDQMVSGMAVKMKAMEVVLGVMKELTGAEVLTGQHSIVVRVTNVPGDFVWMKENLIREGDIVGTVGTADTEERVRRLVERAETLPETKEKVGNSVIRYYLDHFYVKYDVWEGRDGQEGIGTGRSGHNVGRIPGGDRDSEGSDGAGDRCGAVNTEGRTSGTPSGSEKRGRIRVFGPCRHT